MGSSFLTEDIRVIKALPEEVKRDFKEDELTKDIISDERVSFQDWDGYKLEGYWFDETVKVLTKIAPYIEGYAEFLYQEGYKFRIVFKEGKVFREIAEESWGNGEELALKEPEAEIKTVHGGWIKIK